VGNPGFIADEKKFNNRSLILSAGKLTVKIRIIASCVRPFLNHRSNMDHSIQILSVISVISKIIEIFAREINIVCHFILF
jgi:hypothetical protein